MRCRAFTLVELLVVIGIIGLLIAILLPALQKARLQSQEIVCQSNLRQFGAAVEMYCDANQGWMPQKGPDGSSTTTNFFGPSGGVIGYDDPSLWFNALPKYAVNKSYYQMLLDDYQGRMHAPEAGDNNIFICPAAGPAGTQGTNDIVSGNYFLLYGQDSTGTIPGNQFKFACSYVYNSKFTDTIGVTGSPKLKLTSLRPASLCVVMVEKLANSGEFRDAGVQKYAAMYPTVYGSKINALGLNNKTGQPKSNWTRFTTRHRGGGHLLFADGHVAWFSWPETQIQPDEMPYNAATSDANQYNKMIWSIAGPIN